MKKIIAAVFGIGLAFGAGYALAATVDPNMGFSNPEVGDSGTGWASNLRTALTLIGAHDHTTGKGVKVPTAGLNINADLDFNANDATEVRSIRFDTAAVSIVASDRRAVYPCSGELCYIDESGNITILTNNGSVAGPVGTITGMTGSASVVYSPLTNTFAFTDDAGAPGGLDTGCIRIAEEVSGGKGPVICSNAATAADFNFTFPASLPGSTTLQALESDGDLVSAPTGIVTSTLIADGTGVTFADVAAGFQVGYASTYSSAGSDLGTATVPTDDTAPIYHTGSGNETLRFTGLSTAYTPKKVGNFLEISALIHVGSDTDGILVCGLYKDPIAGTTAASATDYVGYVAASMGNIQLEIAFRETVASLSAATWEVACGNTAGAADIKYNLQAANARFGSTESSHLRIREVAQ